MVVWSFEPYGRFFGCVKGAQKTVAAKQNLATYTTWQKCYRKGNPWFGGAVVEIDTWFEEFSSRRARILD